MKLYTKYQRPGPSSFTKEDCKFFLIWVYVNKCLFVFVLRFYGSVNPMGSCQAWSVYLTTCLLGRLSPLSG